MKRIISIVIIIALLISALATAGYFLIDGVKLWVNSVLGLVPEINGKDITDYKIVYDADGLDYNLRAAEYIRDSIREACGVTVEIVDDTTAESEREIVVGETSRQISAELNEATEGVQFSMLAKDGTVALEGDFFVIAAAAYYFVDTYVLGGDDVTVPDGVTVREPIRKEAKNLIMLIGDGMGVYQTRLFEYMTNTSDFSDGEDIFYGYMLPYLGYSRTMSYDYKDEADRKNATDSAAGGTALSTGYKTHNDYLGLDKNQGKLQNLTELAAELGKATAIVSTDKDTGATPSSFTTHTLSRDDTTEIIQGQHALTEKYGTIIECTNRTNCNKRSSEAVEEDITRILGQLDGDEEGFFIMYEEAHIDKKGHSHDVDSTFLALIRFNQAIALFMEYAFYNPDTAVLITADHETCGLYPNEDGVLEYTEEYHTRDDVPVFAWGCGMEQIDGKTVENIEIAHLFASLMGVDDFGDRSGGWYDDIYGEGGNTEDNPGTDNPGTDDPGTDDPGTDDPGTDNPGTDDPGTDNPGTDDPGEDNPGSGGGDLPFVPAN